MLCWGLKTKMPNTITNARKSPLCVFVSISYDADRLKRHIGTSCLDDRIKPASELFLADLFDLYSYIVFAICKTAVDQFLKEIDFILSFNQ